MARRKVRCQQCMFKSAEGNKEPCSNCDEIAAVRKEYKYKFKNNFKLINKDELSIIEEAKKKLNKKLIKLAGLKPILSTNFDFLEDCNIMLTGFVSDVDCANVTVYQLIINKDKKMKMKRILLGTNMIIGFNKAYKNYLRLYKNQSQI